MPEVSFELLATKLPNLSNDRKIQIYETWEEKELQQSK